MQSSTLSIDDVKALVTAYEQESTAIRKKMLPVPDGFMMPLSDYEEYGPDALTVDEFVRLQDLAHVPEEAVAMHAKLVEDLAKFSSIINSKRNDVVKFNEVLDAEADKLYANFHVKITTIPEFHLDGCITVNKKNVHPDDFDAFIDIYKALGFTHYVIKSGSDLLYYSREKGHFNTIKEKFIDEMPKALRKKYPTILNFMQNGVVETNPIHGDGLYKVMSAKQA